MIESGEQPLTLQSVRSSASISKNLLGFSFTIRCLRSSTVVLSSTSIWNENGFLDILRTQQKSLMVRVWKTGRGAANVVKVEAAGWGAAGGRMFLRWATA